MGPNFSHVIVMVYHTHDTLVVMQAGAKNLKSNPQKLNDSSIVPWLCLSFLLGSRPHVNGIDRELSLTPSPWFYAH